MIFSRSRPAQAREAALKFQEHDHVDCFVPLAAERTTRPIEQRPLGFVVIAISIELRFDDNAREFPGAACSQ